MLFGSKARLTARISSRLASFSCLKAGAFDSPMPCSADVVPPTLTLSKSVWGDSLRLSFLSSEVLDTESVQVHLTADSWSEDLVAEPVPGGEGLEWQAFFAPTQDYEDLHLQVCAMDLAGNHDTVEIKVLGGNPDG